MTRMRSTLSAVALAGVMLAAGGCGTHGAGDRTTDSSMQKAVDASLTVQGGAAAGDSVRSGMADSGGTKTMMSDSVKRAAARDSAAKAKRPKR